ncbi:MAG TPA: adenylate/guanylate cyclase domain-containing protein, partial [Spirochaetia bacterium]|nr:adenylate/guanylate cyclase domain-containing protein [Spirochaetia bacterium]
MATVNRSALEDKTAQSADVVPGKILADVREFLLSATDPQLININPFRLASAWRVNRLAVLKAFLHLTRNGLFNLYWTIHCPSCKGATQESQSLASLHHGARCPFCAIDFSAGFDRSVAVTFGVNPAVIRPGEMDDFTRFSGSFDLEPGISIELDPGESHYLKADLKPGNYMLVSDDKKVINVAVSDGQSPAPQKLTIAETDDAPLLTVVTANAGVAEVIITNKGNARKNLVFSRMSIPPWPNAALVSSLQEFRDLFSSQMLSLDETFAIESLSFLFTDIKGSTELYERLGDSVAFSLVKEHFYIMERIVRANNGAVVKTIGDAVMAVFMDAPDALRSAVEMIDAFDDLETAQKLRNSIIVKIGVHYGPCIAVTLNERLDYFGTTVNIAARVQGLSDGRNVMVSDALFRESGAGTYLAQKRWKGEPFTTSLKGLKA